MLILLLVCMGGGHNRKASCGCYYLLQACDLCRRCLAAASDNFMNESSTRLAALNATGWY